MIIHTFNTGRYYTQHGQRIAFCHLPDGRIAFIDVDRAIHYVTPPAPRMTPIECQRFIMEHYDRGGLDDFYSIMNLFRTHQLFHDFRSALTRAALLTNLFKQPVPGTAP